MRGKPETAAPIGRKKKAQGNSRSNSALGSQSKFASNTDGTEAYASLPAGWNLMSIGEPAAKEPNSITDGPFGSKLKTAHYTQSGPRVIRLTNIGDGEFV